MDNKWKRTACSSILLAVAFAIGSILLAEQNQVEAQGSLLQQMIDQAEPGSTVTIPEGRYVGPVVLNKPLRLEGTGLVTVENPTQGPIIRVETDGAEIADLRLSDSREDAESVAVSVTGSGNKLFRLRIATHGYGIRLNNAHGNLIEGLEAEGLAKAGQARNEEDFVDKGNGIDLRESHDNVLRGNRIGNMYDGIYIEKGKSNRVENNMVTGSRYGYHLMFSVNTVVEGNSGSRNVTGAMVMSDKGAQVRNNDFARQSANATAQGILLFDVTGALVECNRVEGNRLGLYAQTIRSTEIRSNRFLRNFVGLQLTDARDSVLTGNEFVANVVQAQASSEGSNRFELNYWDNHNGLDLEGDGVSNLTFRAGDFFLKLTEKNPAYQIFFGSPGMVLLEGLFQKPMEEAFTDTAPLMKSPFAEGGAPNGWKPGLLVVGLALLAGSGAMIWTGGRKR